SVAKQAGCCEAWPRSRRIHAMECSRPRVFSLLRFANRQAQESNRIYVESDAPRFFMHAVFFVISSEFLDRFRR
ncbi:MAG: hypothetical protein OXF56_27270, partial [Rhodobacteraceae bacterium]|nr:hypothetical protein [Paracoccaceae bacterium]